MKKIIILFGMVLLAVCMFNSCKNNKGELMNPTMSCDTSNVKYSGQITDILRNNCYRCHSATSTIGPFPLDTYAAVQIRAANGSLWGAVSHASGFSPMPKDAGQLSPCDLAKIKKWLDDGFPNN